MSGEISNVLKCNETWNEELILKCSEGIHIEFGQMKNGIGSISQIALKGFKMKNRIRSPTNGTLNEEISQMY